MNLIKRWAYLPVGLGVIVLLFVITSLFDVVINVFYPRFYSTAAFIVSFGTGGIFAGVLGYTQAVSWAPVKNEFTRWSIIIMTWIIALLFIFPLSIYEGGEYQAAFIAYGITMALSSLLFVKGKVDM